MNGRECRERRLAYIHRQNVPPSLHVSLGTLAKAHQSRHQHQLNIILGNSFLNEMSALDADSGRLPSFQATSRMCQGAVDPSRTSAVCRDERNQETKWHFEPPRTPDISRQGAPQ